MKYVILILFLIISNNYIFSQISNPVVEIENIDLNLDPVYNGWIYNQDTFVVYKISLEGNLDIIFNDSSGLYGLKYNILFDSTEIMPLQPLWSVINDINNPAWLLVANYVGIDYSLIGYGTNISLSSSIFNYYSSSQKMLTIEYASSTPLDSSILDYCNNTLMYLPFKIQNPCNGGFYDIEFVDGYDDLQGIYLNNMQQNSCMLLYGDSLSLPFNPISVEDSTLSILNGMITQPAFDVATLQNGNMLELIVSGGTMPYFFQWFDQSMNVVSGATYSVFYPSQNGTFYYEVTDANNCNITGSIDFSSLDLNENNNLINYYFSSNIISVQIGGDKDYNFNLKDITGKIIFTKNNIGNNLVFDVDLSSGVYFIEFFNSNKYFFEKIIYVK